MPTVINEAGFKVMVLTRSEHAPAHVHVYKTGGECRVLIDVLPAQLWDYDGMSAKETRQAEELVRTHQAECLKVWRKFNGHIK